MILWKYILMNCNIYQGISRRYRVEEQQVEQYNGKALGVFEVDNLVAAYVALDAASKAADVSI